MNPDAGWYPDLTNPGHERLWTGERWIAWIRPNRLDRAEANPAGWRPDVGHPGFERLWSGEMWTDEIRRAGEAGPPGPGVTAPGEAVSAATAVPVGPVLLPPSTARSHGATYHDGAPPTKLATLGTIVQVAFGLTIFAEVGQLIADQRYIGLQNELLSGRLPALSRLESVVHTLRTLYWINLLLGAVTAILFIAWFFQAYRNLVRAGIHDLRYGPGWAIGSWFIPIFSLFRPKQIANDLWKGSAGAATVGAERRHELPLPASLNWWWALWLIGTLLAGFANRTIADANAHAIYTLSALHDERSGLWVLQVGLVALIAAAVLALSLVRQISRWQDAYFRSPVDRGRAGASFPITTSDS